MLLFWIDYTYCYRVFCGYLGLTKIHKRHSARVELFCPKRFLASQREPEGTKRLQSCFERVLVKHGHLESKNKLPGVIMEAINETKYLVLIQKHCCKCSKLSASKRWCRCTEPPRTLTSDAAAAGMHLDTRMHHAEKAIPLQEALAAFLTSGPVK